MTLNTPPRAGSEDHWLTAIHLRRVGSPKLLERLKAACPERYACLTCPGPVSSAHRATRHSRTSEKPQLNMTKPMDKILERMLSPPVGPYRSP